MAKFSCLPTLSVVKRKKSKAFSKDADDNKKGSSKGDLRVKPIHRFSSSSENGLKEQFLPVSNSVPSVDKGSSVIRKVLSDVSLARTEFTGDAAYEGGDEHDEIQSMKREYSDFDLQSKELASHGSNADFSSYVFEKTDLTAPNQKGGYSSDAQEPGNKLDGKWKKVTDTETDWVALSSISSHVDRVNAWVNSLDDSSFIPVNSEEGCDEMEEEETADLNRLESKDSSDRASSNSNRRVAEEVTQANIIIQSLNTLSTVAHIPGLALKVIPSISSFACLRSVNLSGNCIVTITPGSLPKSLHTLDLSRNKIATMEGLKDLERLRVLNISYNRIAKIGHGLSSCTLIKELYLAGNKISNVEGLHRLLKLTVLDLSFNKIITAKGLGQLVANYNSLLAVNLVGNPILANIGDDQLRKAVLSLLPHVTYLNKQPIKPLKVREVVSEKVTKAALGDAGGNSKRKLTKRLSQGSGSFAKSKVAETTKHAKGKRSTSAKYAQ